MFIDLDKLGLYQLVREQGEAKGLERGLERGHQEIILKLLAKLPPEQVADMSGMSLAKIKALAVADHEENPA